MNVCCQIFSLTCLLVLTIAFSLSSPFIIFLFKFVDSREAFLDLVMTSQPLTHANVSAVCRTRCYKRDDHYNDKNGNVIKSPAWKRFKVLTIYTNHPGGNLVHELKAIKFDVLGE